MAELADIKQMKDRALEILVVLEKANNDDVIKSYVETNTLRVQLTTEEIIAAGDDLAEALGEITDLESELDELKKHFKSRITELENKVEQRRKKVHDKSEYRKVDCVEVKNNTNGDVIRIRMDTNEILDERNMTADERQGSLWDDDETVNSQD